MTAAPGTGLLGFDHLEFYVSDAQLAAYFYRTAFGFEPLMYAGPETGVPDRLSILVGVGSVRLLLTSAVHHESPVARVVAKHGDGVKRVAFRVTDVDAAFRHAVAGGAEVLEPPHVDIVGAHAVKSATVRAFGHIEHSFVSREQGDIGAFPSAIALAPKPPLGDDCDIFAIDHLAVCLPPDGLQPQVDWYNRVLGLEVVSEQNLRTETTGMNSKAIAGAHFAVKFALQEPAPGKRKGQIEEFIELFRGPGVQHAGYLTSNIVATARRLRSYGVSFLPVPDWYYESLHERVGDPGIPLEVLRDLRILVARDETGLLYQSFTKPIHSVPTYFSEVIERRGSTGFGADNVKALFGAIEREQTRREPGP